MNHPRNIGCKVEGCDEPHRALGYCSIHYQRVHRLGTPHLPSPGVTRISDMRKPRRPRVEDAIKVRESIVGTITLAEWKRQRATARASVHVVVPQQPRWGGGGDAA